MKGHPKRVDFISIDVEAWYTKKPSLERGGHRTKRDIHTYIHTERLTHMQLYIVRWWKQISTIFSLVIQILAWVG